MKARDLQENDVIDLLPTLKYFRDNAGDLGFDDEDESLAADIMCAEDQHATVEEVSSARPNPETGEESVLIYNDQVNVKVGADWDIPCNRDEDWES